MDDRPAIGGRGPTWHACPFVDRNDNRCTSRFSLGRIDQAFSVCFGAYRACPMYHRIAAEMAANTDEKANRPPRERSVIEPPLITITTHGRAVPLRETGT